MTSPIADDAAAINARLREIQDERQRGIRGAADTPAAPAPSSTQTGSGGFKTPAGKPWPVYEG